MPSMNISRPTPAFRADRAYIPTYWFFLSICAQSNGIWQILGSEAGPKRGQKPAFRALKDVKFRWILWKATNDRSVCLHISRATWAFRADRAYTPTVGFLYSFCAQSNGIWRFLGPEAGPKRGQKPAFWALNVSNSAGFGQQNTTIGMYAPTLVDQHRLSELIGHTYLRSCLVWLSVRNQMKKCNFSDPLRGGPIAFFLPMCSICSNFVPLRTVLPELYIWVCAFCSAKLSNPEVPISRQNALSETGF